MEGPGVFGSWPKKPISVGGGPKSAKFEQSPPPPKKGGSGLKNLPFQPQNPEKGGDWLQGWEKLDFPQTGKFLFA